MALASIVGPWTSEISPEALEQANEVIYIVDGELRIVYCNPAWDRFAMANGGERCLAARTVGTQLTDCLTPQLRSLYMDALEECLREKASIGFDYECSSAGTFRQFHMQFVALRHWNGILVINALRIECPHTREVSGRPLREYVNEFSTARLCANCRRSWNFVHNRWDWVPSLLNSQIRISHALCPVCLDYVYRNYLQRQV